MRKVFRGRLGPKLRRTIIQTSQAAVQAVQQVQKIHQQVNHRHPKHLHSLLHGPPHPQHNRQASQARVKRRFGVQAQARGLAQILTVRRIHALSHQTLMRYQACVRALLNWRNYVSHLRMARPVRAVSSNDNNYQFL